MGDVRPSSRTRHPEARGNGHKGVKGNTFAKRRHISITGSDIIIARSSRRTKGVRKMKGFSAVVILIFIRKQHEHAQKAHKAV